MGLFLVVSALGMNQLVMRLPALYVHDAVFWALEGLLCAFALFLMVRGLPGFHALPVVGWVLSLLFLMHVVQNYRARAAWLEEQGEEAYDEALQARAEQIRAALSDKQD
jgi:hypothetical protein